MENENKKLKSTLEQINNEIKSVNVINEKNEKKIKEQNSQIEKMKGIITTYNSFKAQKDNLLLANTKYASEIKRLNYDLEKEREQKEKNQILIEKLNKEISFYTLNINKYKTDAAKALQDTIEYQQIVSALQSQVNEYKIILNKIKQNKK